MRSSMLGTVTALALATGAQAQVAGSVEEEPAPVPAPAEGTDLAPEPETGPETVVIVPEEDEATPDELLREVDITDPDAPPIEDAANVVPEGDPSEEAEVPEIAAETEMTSPSHTAATPELAGEEAMRPAGAPEDFAVADMRTMDPTELLGVRVYSADDDHIGDIDRWLGEAPGEFPEAAVVDVGGFLGIGGREVAFDSALLVLMADADGNDMRVYVEMTEDDIEALPENAD